MSVLPNRSTSIALCLALASVGQAQDRLRTMPGYERYQRMAPLIASSLGSSGRGFGRGSGVTWSNDSRSVEFDSAGKRMRFDVGTKKLAEATAATPPVQGGGRGRGGFGSAPERGRQFASALAPAGNHLALYRDRNIWIGDSTGADAIQITNDGSVQS
ncbi:MAG TPA: hypothetical protein VGP95_00275, partial [Gemmatimonadaceae bacterium]|nr:hypothetical protein [Gemmatimonadaceae bacterium]